MTTTAEIPPTTIVDAPRAEYVKGLRALADAIEENLALPLPYDGRTNRIAFHFLSTADPRAEMAAAARALPCDLRKRVEDYGTLGAYLYLDGELHGVKVELVASRNSVCERVVTGTHEETRKVKDPEALATVPEIEVTETVEDVEWRCAPILAPAAMVATGGAL